MSADEFTSLTKSCNVFDSSCCCFSLKMIKSLIAAKEQVPLISELIDALDSNFHISLNTPHILVTIHAKVAGLKETSEKIKSTAEVEP